MLRCCASRRAAVAHDIPDDVQVQVFVKPEGQRLQLLVRVPLAAMREVDVPLRGPGYLDLARADAALRDAADAVDRRQRRALRRRHAPAAADARRARVSLASDRSFASYEEALAHLQRPPLPPSTELYWNQQLLDVLFEYPIASERVASSRSTRGSRGWACRS